MVVRMVFFLFPTCPWSEKDTMPFYFVTYPISLWATLRCNNRGIAKSRAPCTLTIEPPKPIFSRDFDKHWRRTMAATRATTIQQRQAIADLTSQGHSYQAVARQLMLPLLMCVPAAIPQGV
jgi:hypothetical protein